MSLKRSYGASSIHPLIITATTVFVCIYIAGAAFGLHAVGESARIMRMRKHPRFARRSARTRVKLNEGALT